MHIRVVTPITAEDFGVLAIDDILQAARADDQVDHVRIEQGPASIECEWDEALAAPDTLRKIVEAEREGVDGVVINCMGDPALYPARERVSIPVVGPFQAAGHLASMLGHRFSVITVLESVVPMFWDRAAVYGFAGRMASVRVINIPVLDLEKDRDRMVERLVAVAREAVSHDGADTVVFGCTGMAGVAARVESGLSAAGFAVPVIDPAPAALKLCESLVDMRLGPSRRAFMRPRAKAVPGFADLQTTTEFVDRSLADS